LYTVMLDIMPSAYRICTTASLGTS
jgi:hypothetical protein